MNRMKIGVSLFSVCVASVACGVGQSSASAQVQEIPVRGLQGIAKVRRDRRGREVIYYNPRTCRRLGPELCSFFRAHEHAHVRLNHLGRGIPVRQAEQEADIWAARNSSPQAVKAAVRYFRKGNGGSLRHGSSLARARRVLGSASRTRTLSGQGRRKVFAPFGR